MDNVPNGLYLFYGNGIVSTNVLNNPIVEIYTDENNVKHLSLTRANASSSRCWRYDEENDVIIDNGTSIGGITTNIRSQIATYGFASGSNYIIHNTMSKKNIIGKFIPTEEVSGLNNLNYIEDELTDV